MTVRASAALAAVVLALGAGACTDPAPPQRSAGDRAPAVVRHVIDGDTVQLTIGGTDERVRLLGIDTPETVKPDAPVECYGPEASARTKELLPEGTAVTVQRDEQARDRFGRLLLYVWRAGDDLFINASLVADGYADTLSIEPNTAHRRDLAALASQARAAEAGLWGACPPS